MDITIAPTKDRVRDNTSDKINKQIDLKMAISGIYYSHKDVGRSVIEDRIKELDNEWDIERVLELNVGTLALSGVILAATVNKKWLVLPALVTTFLIQHAVQGWCPPLYFLRRLGIRTQKEIDTERYRLAELLENKD